MLANENANDMYSQLNILVEDVNVLGPTQICEPDVVRKILSVLPIEKYGHIITVLHQMDFPPLHQFKYWERWVFLQKERH
jgi:hypothetical protein